MREAILELEDVKVCRGAHLVVDVGRLAVARGETVAVVGPNGAGKTTLLQVMACLLRPREGKVSVFGERLERRTDLVRLRRRMALVLQRPYLLDGTVFDNLAVGLRLRGVPKDEVRARVERALDTFGIEHLAGRRARTLSGGESQRVSLARAFALDPELLFLDEPTSSLDMPTRMELLRELGEVVRMTRVTTVFVTHDVVEIPFVADRTLVMKGGRIIADGPLRSVLGADVRQAVAGVAASASWILCGDGDGGAGFPVARDPR
ncbi:MAG: ATP-binding cassette domain-containing protein [Firmicutes bacterium]|nr:ATP-binding cassette domain-containing protein [Bacillota bacterium]MDH7494548.1 ATP-binding cassette domain-containing protein [Bacillota bacterium]